MFCLCDTALPASLEQRHGRRHAHVEGLDSGRERDRDRRVARAAHERSDALPLRAEYERCAIGQVDVPELLLAVGRGGIGPQAVALDVRQVPGEVRDDRDREVLHRPRRRPTYDRRHDGRPVRGNDDARRAGACRAPDDGPEVSGVRHLVEAADKRPLHRSELPGVRVRVRLAPGDDALVVGRAGRVGELTLLVHARSRAVREPFERGDGALARPELENGPPAAERLANGVAAVDEVAGHERGTSS